MLVFYVVKQGLHNADRCGCWIHKQNGTLTFHGRSNSINMYLNILSVS